MKLYYPTEQQEVQPGKFTRYRTRNGLNPRQAFEIMFAGPDMDVYTGKCPHLQT